jgi:cytochrome c oxidase subunit 2
MMDLFRALLGLPPAASTVAGGVDGLHLFVISVTMAMSAYVFVAAAWFMIRYARRSKGQLTTPLLASARSEVLTITAVVGVFVLWWVLGFRQFVRMTTPPRKTDVIHVEAKQWMWKFTYADGRSTNDVLTVPVGTPIKLVMNSRDVIHSFFVPAFRIKSDVVPGRTMTAWFEATQPGTYPIWCAEYCGVSHSLMRGEVVVLSLDDYERWKSRGGREAELAEADCGRGPGSCTGGNLVDLGRQVAVRRACVACHTLDGQRHVGPTWRGLYGADRTLTDGRHVVADEAYLTRAMMEPNVELVAGYPQVMPTYQGSLSAAEAGALIELIRSLGEGAEETEGAPAPGKRSAVLPRLEITQTDGGGVSP